MGLGIALGGGRKNSSEKKAVLFLSPPGLGDECRSLFNPLASSCFALGLELGAGNTGVNTRW